uniref:uncharacterized protein LOC132693808 isoform X2 n=1 Tax=Panthera onca TaxID=9690 RepID=UPI0029532E87|nr:uncharacterized protein LOC132693808 isoform X2 [Panthera onca]
MGALASGAKQLGSGSGLETSSSVASVGESASEPWCIHTREQNPASDKRSRPPAHAPALDGSQENHCQWGQGETPSEYSQEAAPISSGVPAPLLCLLGPAPSSGFHSRHFGAEEMRPERWSGGGVRLRGKVAEAVLKPRQIKGPCIVCHD